MIKQHYEQASRRALNIIWNAAGRYDFTPCFTAFHPNGQPDDYFNIIIGLTEKWLGLSGVTAFFSLFEGHARAEEFDEILWLGLENYVFERELPDRPVLKELRKKRGEEFFLVQQTLSEQQMALQSMPVYRQQQARWAFVTGRSLPILSSKASKMMEALRFPGTLDPDEVIFCMRRILKDFFHYDPVSDPKEKRGLTGFRAWYRRFASRRQPGADVLLIRTGSGQGTLPMQPLFAGMTGSLPAGVRSRMQKIFSTSERCSGRPALRKMSGNRRKLFCALVLTRDAGCGSPTAREQRRKGPAHQNAERSPTRSGAWNIRKKETSASFRSAIL